MHGSEEKDDKIAELIAFRLLIRANMRLVRWAKMQCRQRLGVGAHHVQVKAFYVRRFPLCISACHRLVPSR